MSSSSSSAACEKTSVVSSSSQMLESVSSSSESLTAEEAASRLAKAKSEETLFYLILIPRFGDHAVLAFKEGRKMVERLTYWLSRKQSGLYEGEILTFHGRTVEYSEPIMNYRVNVPDVGELAVSDAGRQKYEKPVPKIIE